MSKQLRCPSCKGGKVGTLRYQMQLYLQCLLCKFWCTKFTPENPGSFAEGA